MSELPARTYSLHGLRLEVAGWPPAIEAVDARLRRLAEDGDLPSGLLPVLQFHFSNGDGGPIVAPATGRPVYDPPDGRVIYSDRDDLLYIEIGAPGSRAREVEGLSANPSTYRSTVLKNMEGPRLAALCRAGEGWVKIAARRPAPGDVWLLSHPLFTLPLCELAKRRGLFSLHAAGLVRGGRALLLPGESGAGKSTLAVALARAGFGLLGDDTVFLSRGPGGPRVLGFPDEIDLTDDGAGLLAAGALLPPVRAEGARKRSVAPERLAAGGLAAESAPGWLVFPRISGREESELSPLSPDEALLALAPDVLLTEPRASQAHLDTLAELVAASECWRLATGRDLAGAVRILAELRA